MFLIGIVVLLGGCSLMESNDASCLGPILIVIGIYLMFFHQGGRGSS